MALQYCDSFVPYGNLLSRYNRVIGVTAGLAYGRGGRYGVQLSQSGPGELSKTLTPTSAGVTGFAFFPPNLMGGQLYSLQCVNSPLTLGTIFSVWILPDSTVAAYAGVNSELISNPKSPVIAGSTWNYLETKYSLARTSNVIVPTLTVRLNGQQIISGAAAHGYTDSIAQDGKGNYHTFRNAGFPTSNMGDLYICDTTGSYNNDFLGDVKVGAIFPRQDVITQWLNSSGSVSTNLINEHIPDDDATYIYSNTPGNFSSFYFDNVASFSGQILAAQASIYARKTDEGYRVVRHIVGNDGFEGPDIYLGDSYSYNHIPYDIDPVNSAVWTPAGINAEKFGIILHS